MRLEDLEITILVTTGAAGSFYMQSLFDSHPEILMIPYAFEYPELCEEMKDASEIEWADRVVKYLSHIFKNKETSMHGDFTNYKASESIFRKCLIQELKRIGLTRTGIVYAVHTAFNQATNGDLEGKRVLFLHVHHLSKVEWAKSVREDFPNAKFVYMVRRPAVMIQSFITSNLRYLNVSLTDSFRPFCLGLEFLATYPAIIANMLFLSGTSKIIKLEDLHSEFECVMTDLAQFVGIEFNETLLNSTMGGKPLIYSSPNNRNLKGKTVSLSKLSHKDFYSKEELNFLETLFQDYMQTAGYDFETRADFTLADAIQLFESESPNSIYHPKFYFPLNRHQYNLAINAHRDIVLSCQKRDMFRKQFVKSLFIIALDKLGIGAPIYTLAVIKNKWREFRVVSMVKLFAHYADRDCRIATYKTFFS